MFFFSAFALLVLLTSLLLNIPAVWHASSLALAIGIAFSLKKIEQLKGYQYTAWIIVAVIAGMMYPEAFTKWGSIDLRNKWLILIVIQLVMFGMGTQMSLKAIG